MLEEFRVAKYRFTLRALEDMTLPKFKGALLRGALGYSLKRVCWFGGDSNMSCRLCILHPACPYAYLFDTSLSKRPGTQGNDMPRPYVLEPPLDGKTDYRSGDELSFELVLVGKAIEYLPYFFAAYVEAGQVGLGKEWGRYELVRVEQLHPARGEARAVFQDGAWLPIAQEWLLDFLQLCEMARQLPASRLVVSFVTPTRLPLTRRTAALSREQVDGLAAEPVFPVLFDNLLTRVALMYRVHCGTVWTDSRDELRAIARKVQSECDTHWVEWSRASTRQGRTLECGGLLGRARYSGDLGPLLPFLLLGSLVHVGQKCDVGNGWYRVGWRPQGCATGYSQ